MLNHSGSSEQRAKIIGYMNESLFFNSGRIQKNVQEITLTARNICHRQQNLYFLALAHRKKQSTTTTLAKAEKSVLGYIEPGIYQCNADFRVASG